MMLLEMAASGHGERIAIQNGADRLDYTQLLRAAGAAAQTLRASEARHLALLDVSSLAVPVALFASAWAGIPYVPLNYRASDEEILALALRIEPALLLTDRERLERFAFPSGITARCSGDFLAASRNGASLAEGDWGMEGDAIAILLFTSGTTGAPKAAVLRQRHLVSYVLGSVEFGSAAEDDAALVSVPPYHVAGVAAILSSVYAGRRIVQLPNFEAREWLRLAREEHITHAFVVPTMLARIVDALDSEPALAPRHLRALSYGGGKMPLPIIERAMRLFPQTDFTNAYGLTETSSTIALLDPDDHRRAAGSRDPSERRRLVSVGRPLPSIELEIHDEEGHPVPAGERGEICVRGDQVAGEYLERGSQLDAQGWFRTRDGGWLDPGGYLFLEGRIDDVIVRGGENLSPGEIEDVLLQHAAVRDAAVVGVPDVQWGEAVAAAIVLREGSTASAGELRDWVRQRLRSSRVPERIEFRDELPYNETGKLLRRRVRAELTGAS